MNYTEIIREKAILCCWWVSHTLLGLNVLLYLACCIVASTFVSPMSYIAWLNHCCQWKVT